MRLLGKAIFSLRPGSEFVIKDNDYSTIEWFVLDGEAPSLEEINAEIFRLQQIEEEEVANKTLRKQAILDRLGLTEEEAKLLLS